MELKVIGTGSSGNAYLLQQGEDSLLLDAGLRWQTILAALPRGLRGVKACLVTHEHKDHSKAVDELLRRGVKVVMSGGTWNALETDYVKRCLTIFNWPKVVTAGEAIFFPPFTIVAAQAAHDAAEPLAYLIRHEGTKETILYATDTYVLPNRYPGINHWLVECNYTMAKAEELLDDPAKAPLYDRLMNSHMSLERLVEALKANDLSRTRTIVLIHISNERGDSPLMQDTVQRVTGVRTIAACNGMEIKLGSCPF